MTRMLASVNTPEDAAIALAGGADIIDLTNPTAIRATLAVVDGRRPVSVAAGHPPMQPRLVAETVRALAATGVDYVRLGIARNGDVRGCIDALAETAGRLSLIAVFLAGADPDLSLLPLLKQGGFAGAMIDVGPNSPGALLDHFDMPRLQGFIEDCHGLGLSAGLAGSLETPDIPRLLVLEPDLLGFDSALREAAWIDLGRTQAVRSLIPPIGLRGRFTSEIGQALDDRALDPEGGAHAVDYRLLSARGQTLPSTGDDVPVDLVFVEDLVLPVFIGAYSRERNAPQNVRFAVTASVMRTGRTAEDMRDVFSYDLITDGIKLLIGSGHVALVETLAERIAAMVLGHPRVTKVVVRVQKLETGSGTVGVEIERIRTAARAIERPVPPRLAEVSGKA